MYESQFRDFHNSTDFYPYISWTLQLPQPIGLLSPARMMLHLLPLLLLLVLDQSKALAKPRQLIPSFKQEILEADQGLKILWLTNKFLTKKYQALILSAILRPYLGALFRMTKSEKNTIENVITPIQNADPGSSSQGGERLKTAYKTPYPRIG